MGPVSINAAFQQEEHQDGKNVNAGRGDRLRVERDRQRSNPPSNLSVSSDGRCVGGMEENSQAPSSIGSMSLHRLNAPALRQIDMIERYVERWQPPQCSVGATSAAENSDITSQREGEVEDFVQVMQQQHPHGNEPTHHHRAACVRSPTRPFHAPTVSSKAKCAHVAENEWQVSFACPVVVFWSRCFGGSRMRRGYRKTSMDGRPT